MEGGALCLEGGEREGGAGTMDLECAARKHHLF